MNIIKGSCIPIYTLSLTQKKQIATELADRLEQITLIKISPEELKNIVVKAVNEALNSLEVKEIAPSQKFVTIDEICKLYKWAKPTVYAWVSKSLIPHSKMSKRLYFNITEIDNWIASRRRKTIAEIELEAETYITAKRSTRFRKDQK